MAEGGNILVIKLGALGDFVQAAGPFHHIRRFHPGAHITLLTTLPFAEFAAKSPWFDEIWVDRRPSFWQLGDVLALRRRLRGGRFRRVYDLQTSDRSGFYFRLLGPGTRPEWSGIAAGCSHPHANPRRDHMHTAERQAEQLAMAGVDTAGAANFSWIGPPVESLGVSVPYALIAPGGAPHRPAKRWPTDRYAAIAREMIGRGWTPAVIGTGGERELARSIAAAAPGTLDLTGRTRLEDLFALGRDARLAIGNDTGPMHAFAAMGCPTMVLYSRESDPALCAQRGELVKILRRDDLASLEPGDVVREIDGLLDN